MWTRAAKRLPATFWLAPLLWLPGVAWAGERGESPLGGSCGEWGQGRCRQMPSKLRSRLFLSVGSDRDG